MDTQLNVPILFIFFNRKEIALQSFAKIKEAKPSKLYLASDGGRDIIPNEKQRVEDIRNILLSEIDWDCETKTLFREKNLGCGQGVSTAIDWLFENEEMGIIIEDDVVVHSLFFSFAKTLLIKFKEDDRIGMIAGRNILKKIPSNDSYCFSKYAATWGWATWKRAWKNMDYNMGWKNSLYKNNILYNFGYNTKEIKKGLYHIKLLEKSPNTTWDYQWVLSLAAFNQLCIFPRVNLCANIGGGNEATHTAYVKQIPVEALEFPLLHPLYIAPDYHFDYLFYRKTNSLLSKIKIILPTWVKKISKKIM